MAQIPSPGVGGGGTPAPVADTYTTESLHFPIDPASSLVVPEGTIFTNQTEIDDFLTANAATHFKYVMDCFDALPHDVYHTVFFELEPGIHRPRNPEPAAERGAWCFADYPGQPRHHEFHRGSDFYGGFLSLTSISYDEAYWTDVHASVPAVGINNSPSYDRYIDVAPGTYTPGELRGLYARIDSYPFYPLLIKENTDSRIHIAQYPGGGIPTTVKIQKQGIIFRNSYDDVSAAVDNPLIFAQAKPELEWSKTLVLDSILFEQYAQNQVVIETEGRIYYDMYASGCDQARMLDDGIDSRGTFINVRRGVAHGQFWRCFWRGQKDSIIAPTNNSQKPFDFSGDQMPQGRWVFADSVVRGCSNPCPIEDMTMLLNNSYWANWSVPPMQFSRCRLSASSEAQFVDCTSRCVEFARDCSLLGSCHFYFDNCGPSTSAHLFYFGDNNNIDFGGSRVIAGPNPNAGRTLYLASSEGNRIVLNDQFADGALSTAGDIYSPRGENSFSDFGDEREPAQQPNGAMAGIVRVLQMSGGMALNTYKNLVFTTTGNLLSYDGGTGVDISGLGVFMLVGPSGDWLVVAVAAVPGSNQTFQVKAQYRETKDYRGNILARTAG